MKALMKVQRGEGNIEVKDIPEPQPGANEVKIEVKAAGICGTDIHIYHDHFQSNPPVVMGHEFCGVVTDVGKDVKDFKTGDRVTSETAAHVCGKCLFCRTGNYNECAERVGIGYGVNGAFTKYIVVRQQIVHRLPDNVDFRAGALSEPLACTVHGITERVGISAGDLAVVVGPGPIGLLSAQVSKVEGATVVVMGISKDKEKLKIATELGADRVVNVEEEDPLTVVKEMSSGYGADVVLECSGSQPGAQLCLTLVRKQGKYSQMGLFGKPIEIDFEQIAYKELFVTGFFTQQWTSWERGLKLLELGKVQTKPLITEELPLTDWKKGFEEKEQAKAIKTLLYPVD